MSLANSTQQRTYLMANICLGTHPGGGRNFVRDAHGLMGPSGQSCLLHFPFMGITDHYIFVISNFFSASSVQRTQLKHLIKQLMLQTILIHYPVLLVTQYLLPLVSHHPIRNIIKHAKKIGTNFGDPSQARILIISLN